MVGVTKDEADEDESVLLLPLSGGDGGEGLDLDCLLDRKCSFCYDHNEDKLIGLEVHQSSTILTVIPLNDIDSKLRSTISGVNHGRVMFV